MKRLSFGIWFLVLGILPLVHSPVYAGDLDIFGYFEPQYSGLYQGHDYYHFQSNKLRVDLKSQIVKDVEVGGDGIFILYFGKKDWNILDFLPDQITALVRPEMRDLYRVTYHDTFFLDNIYARFSNSRVAVTVGKQQISVGTGYFSNPTDIYNKKDILDPTYEQPGHNAIRGDLFLANRLSLMAILGPIGSGFKTSGKFVRVKMGIGHFDVSAITGVQEYQSTDFYTFLATTQKRRIVGTDCVGELLGLGVWGEGAYNFLKDSTDFYEFIIGLDYTFNSSLYTLLEYHHNSLGKTDYDDYDLNDWMRFFTGETRTIGQNQIYGHLRYPLTDLVNIGSSVIISVSDRSGAVVPSINYSMFENVDLTLMFNLYLGVEGKGYSNKLGSGGFLRARVYF